MTGMVRSDVLITDFTGFSAIMGTFFNFKF